MKGIYRALTAAAAVMFFSFTTHAQADVKFGVAAEPYPPFASKIFPANGSAGKSISWMLCAPR